MARRVRSLMENVVTRRFSGVWSHSGWPPIGGACMRSVGMREPKAHFSELVRAAANGELIVLTDYGKPLAVITSIEDEGANRAGRLCRRLEIQAGSPGSSASP